MSTGLNCRRIGGALVLTAALLCTSGSPLQADSTHSQKKTTKKPEKPPLPPLPSGPTGPVQQVPLDSIAAVPPQVSYQNNLLTIVAPNSTLADILRAVRKQTGAEIEIPAAPERVVTRIGPGPAREVMAELLNGSRFNYVLLGSPADDAALTRVVLVAKTGGQEMAANAAQGPGTAQGNNVPPQADMAQDSSDAEAVDDNNADDNAEQAAEPEQQAPPPDQPGVKTPQQMLQEMQQRQMQMQQQQQQGQPGQPAPPPQPFLPGPARNPPEQ